MTDLYRYFNADGVLLYVGVSSNAAVRAAQHKGNKSWWGQVSRIDIQRFGTRREAFDAELVAIRTEYPKYNVLGVDPLASCLRRRKFDPNMVVRHQGEHFRLGHAGAADLCSIAIAYNRSGDYEAAAGAMELVKTLGRSGMAAIVMDVL